MRGAIPPISQYVFMVWCLVKHRDNFTFTFTSYGYFPFPFLARLNRFVNLLTVSPERKQNLIRFHFLAKHSLCSLNYESGRLQLAHSKEWIG
jgi:hypothetical protein